MDKLMKGTDDIRHRPSSVHHQELPTVIMVLEQGRIIERGSHDEPDRGQER